VIDKSCNFQLVFQHPVAGSKQKRRKSALTAYVCQQSVCATGINASDELGEEMNIINSEDKKTYGHTYINGYFPG